MKSLEFLNENIDFIQKTWQSQGMGDTHTHKETADRFGVNSCFIVSHFSFPVEQNIGLAQSQAVVEGECLKRTNRITRTKQVV